MVYAEQQAKAERPKASEVPQDEELERKVADLYR